ncbi:MAG: molybdopterin-dependent oxidoreductase, partial [Gallionellaceae bacterium]|nr:molybdopterin-dependent oxidoreductase [Gallionellaceae bacterium]
MLRLTVNGTPQEAQEGATLLEVLRAAHIDIPTLCHDPRLKPHGACRLCVVQVEGMARPVTSCNTPATDGMVVHTHSDMVERERRTLLKLIARRYPADAFRQMPGKEFHRYLRAYGLEQEMQGQRDPVLEDSSHPYIRVDMSQCVYCYRCVRICEQLQGQFVWKIWHRGDATRIRPDGDSLLDSPCVSCGACVDTCPSGALEDKTSLLARPEKWTRTTCSYCGTGCEMLVGTMGERIVSIRPPLDAPVNKGHLCVKGRYAFEFAHAKDRITTPMIRDSHGQWQQASWEEALGFAAAKLRQILDQHGAGSAGVLGSSRATNEENYLAQKFARLVLNTNNVDCCARVCHTPTAAAMKLMVGTGAATNSYDDIEKAHTILVCGANPTENHPV